MAFGDILREFEQRAAVLEPICADRSAQKTIKFLNYPKFFVYGLRRTVKKQKTKIPSPLIKNPTALQHQEK